MNRDELVEEIRLRYRYRRLILLGQLQLPREAAAALIGPDCAYHLYSRATPGDPSAERPLAEEERAGPP